MRAVSDCGVGGWVHGRADTSSDKVKTVEDVRRGTMGRIFRELRDLAGVTRGGLVLTTDTSMFLRCDELQPQCV
jgi:hypothetical protein